MPYVQKLPLVADAIQDGTRKECSFVPTVTAIAAILNVPGAGAADAIVKGICGQVLAKRSGVESVSLGQPLVVRYENVRVEGFVAR